MLHAVARGRRDLDRGDELAPRQRELGRGIRGGATEERLDGDASRETVGRDDLDVCVERFECDRGIRRVHGVAGAAGDDAVVLVLAVHRRAGGAAVLEAAHAAPEVPAARALAEVAAERSHVPQRRGPDAAGGVGEHGEVLAHRRVLRERRDPHPRTDPHRAVRAHGDLRCAGEVPHIHHRGRRCETLLDPDQEVRAAAEGDGRGFRERAERVGDGVGAEVREGHRRVRCWRFSGRREERASGWRV